LSTYKISFKSDTISGAYAWKQMQSWRAKSRANREQFESMMSQASTTFAGAAIDSAQGLGQIAAQRAIDRINAANAAKQSDALKALNNLVDMTS